MKRNLMKGVVAALFALIVVFGSFSIVATAAEKAEFGGKYGYIIPTDSKLSAQKSSYTFYGNSTDLYFMLFSTGKENSYYTVEIFSSNDYNPDKIVSSFTNAYGKKGTAPLKVKWNFKANPSGTYYGRCYTSILNGEEETIDTSTICKFTIKLNRLGKETVSLTSVTNTSSGVQVKWTGLSTATKYGVYRKAKGEKNWTKIADVKANTTSYTDKNVKSGTQYTYSVKAFDKLYSTLQDKTGLTTIYLSASAVTQPKSSTDIYPIVRWTKVNGCKGYAVYRKGGSLNDSSTWKRIATIKSPTTLSYQDKTATSTDWKYTYTVRPFNGKYYGAVKNSVDYFYVSEPKLKTASSVNGGVKITWLDTNTVSKKFHIHRKAGNETKWTKIGTSTTPSFTDKNVKNGVTYTYTVRTASATNSSSYSKTGIKTTYYVAPKLKKLSIANNGDMTISWNSVSGAKGYYVWRRENSSSWTRIAQIKNPKTLSYKDTTTKKSGVKYSYTVKTYNGKYTSAGASPSLATIYLSIPKASVANYYSTELGSTIKISWNSIAGANSYRIYRKTSTDKSWSTLADNVTDKVYYDKTAKSGVKYYYAVRAKNGSYMSNYNSTALITALATPVLKDAIIADTGVKVTWEAVGGAESYSIFRRTLSGTWENIGTSKTTEFLDTNATAKTTPHLYTVRAVIGSLKSNYMPDGVSNFVKVDSVDALFESNQETNTAFVTVTWKASNAENYEIYRSENGATPVLLTTVSGAETQSYIDNSITQGASYSYTIKPVKTNKLSVSVASETVKWPHPPVPVVPVLATPYYANTELGDRIEVQWEEIETAETYDIYRKTADSDWTYLKTVEKGSEYIYIDTAIETDVTYYYSVKGIASDRDSLFDETGKEALLKSPVAPIEDIFAQITDDPTGNGKKQVTLAWESNENAALYMVMRKTGTDGDWEYMGVFLSCDLLVFTDNTIEQGVTYTYTIHTYAPDRPSIDNMVGKTVIWPADEVPPTEDTTQSGEETTTPDSTEPDTTVPEDTTSNGSGDTTTTPDTTEPGTTVPETTEPTTKPEETTEEGNLDIPDA